MPRHVTLPAPFVTENGDTLHAPTLTYHAWGTLAPAGDNAIVVCHALTGDTDAAAWWEPLIGPGRLLDTDTHFVICLSVPGSPYGALSPRATDPATGRAYGASFPLITVRDGVRLHRAALEALGVRQLALAIGGSLGGMFALEWGRHADFVRAIAPLAVGARHSAWAIGWNEAQRQAIAADPAWNGGDYDPADPPRAGLAAARAIAMLSYRTPAIYEERHGRDRAAGRAAPFEAARYLQYQGRKLADRFDAACYVALTRTMDSHDAARGASLAEGLADLALPAFVLGIDGDVLYPLAEQEALAEALPNATLATLRSPYGHDAFLVAFDDLRARLAPWLARHLAPSTSFALAG